MFWKSNPWAGVFAATLCPFRRDQSVDESGLIEYISEVVSVEGIRGIVCNGHTGEIMSLVPRERAQVTQLVAETVSQLAPDTKVVSGVMAEGIYEVLEHTEAAKVAGADAVLMMPPHHWLRFGRSSRTAVTFCREVADAADIDIILHQYPSWTKASYSLEEMVEIASHPRIVMIKMGTRDMARWSYDYEVLKRECPRVSITTCHDEFLFPTLLDGADGVLVGLAGFAPELVVDLVHAALEGNLPKARKAQQRLAPLVHLIYALGEPGCGAHQRMKVARWLLGKFPSPHFRLPVNPLAEHEVESIRIQLMELQPSIRLAPSKIYF